MSGFVQYSLKTTFDQPSAPDAVMVPGYDPQENPHFEEFIPRIDPDYLFRETYLSDISNWWTMRCMGGMSDQLYLFGEAAAGKTSLVTQFFARLNVPVITITGDEDRDVPELISFRQIVGGDTVADDGPITRAMRMGAVLLINEVSYFRPQTLSALNDILESGRVVIPESGELVVAQPGFSVVCTDNTNGSSDPEGRYAGTKGQNEAFLDRFAFVQIEAMEPAEEVKLLKRRFPGQQEPLLKKVVELANMVRQACRDGRLSQTMSLRSVIRLINWWMMKKPRYGDEAIFVAMDRAFSFRLYDSERLSVDAYIETIFNLKRK